MEGYIAFVVGLAYTLIWAFGFYAIGINLIPKKQAEKFFEVVPLYPKRKYAIPMYCLAGVLWMLLAPGRGLFDFLVGKIVVALVSVFISSQLIRVIAKLRKEDVEETIVEEQERKRKMLDRW